MKSTIERLAELAKGATPGPWHKAEYLGGSATVTTKADRSRGGDLFEWTSRDNATFIAACNPAAIAQARAEYAELENGVSEIFAKHCSDFPDAATANNATKLYAIEGSLSGLSGACDDLHSIIVELERRNAELVEALTSGLADICGAKLCEVNSMSSRAEMLRLMTNAADTLRAALAHSAQEKADAAE